ncbi:MAG TPA: BON domain-containing protein [Spirillospora sp.]|nr:BON domain-containing protein [Spirillospora sp.]
MAQARVQSDAELEEAIDAIITHYPPLMNDRSHLTLQVENGVVTVSGHTRTSITRTYLVDALKQMPGIVSLHIDNLYSDDQIRLEVGKVIPVGVYSNVKHGVVILSGQLPTGKTIEEVIAAVEQVKGVRAVRAQLTGT